MLAMYVYVCMTPLQNRIRIIDAIWDRVFYFCRLGASGMLPVHMACLNGYSNCVENLLSTGKCVVKVVVLMYCIVFYYVALRKEYINTENRIHIYQLIKGRGVKIVHL